MAITNQQRDEALELIALHDAQTHFRHTCREIRESYGLNGSQIGIVTGFGTNTWRNYEAGREVPTRSNASVIFLIQDPVAMKCLLDIMPERGRDQMGKAYLRVYGLVIDKIRALEDELNDHRKKLISTKFEAQYKSLARQSNRNKK